MVEMGEMHIFTASKSSSHWAAQDNMIAELAV